MNNITFEELYEYIKENCDGDYNLLSYLDGFIANMMKELFLKKIKDMTADQVAMSYIGSIEGSGRNGAQVKEF